ncbi:hypothetical protein CK203_114382 [Vitis vinifera]|uniref:Uncharacterized protein n=1 Tax=Vitis vinifera TaxID=29760 RepID=A0A438D4U9_VITVI|nr:hypothetical protein CK203_114382 [Vitis vinifera]
MYIRGQGKIGYLIGDTKEPAKTDPRYATWDAENFMIMAWMTLEINPKSMSYNSKWAIFVKCVVRKAGGMLCLGRSSLDLWKTQPYWALQQRLLAILITNVIRMTSQEFGVIIVINHATRETCWKLHGKPADWKPIEWKTNKQDDSNHFPAKAHAVETPSLSKEQLD